MLHAPPVNRTSHRRVQGQQGRGWTRERRSSGPAYLLPSPRRVRARTRPGRRTDQRSGSHIGARRCPVDGAARFHSPLPDVRSAVFSVGNRLSYVEAIVTQGIEAMVTHGGCPPRVRGCSFPFRGLRRDRTSARHIRGSPGSGLRRTGRQGQQLLWTCPLAEGELKYAQA